jgi:hypothetical protein
VFCNLLDREIDVVMEYDCRALTARQFDERFP